jgi:hypothetical protein
LLYETLSPSAAVPARALRNRSHKAVSLREVARYVTRWAGSDSSGIFLWRYDSHDMIPAPLALRGQLHRMLVTLFEHRVRRDAVLPGIETVLR